MLGERYRAAREARGLSLSEVAEQIRIRSVYLAAIEDESWGTIGAPVYIRGFLRTYARFLGLDSEEMVGAFAAGSPAAANAAPAVPHETPPYRTTGSAETYDLARPRRQVSSLLIGMASIVAALLIAFVVYNELTIRPTVSPLPLAAASASPPVAAAGLLPPGASPVAGSPIPSAEPTLPPLGAAHSLALVFSAPSWLRVTVDGGVSMEGTFPAGTSKTFYGKSAVVRIGNAAGVAIFVDGKPVGKLGNSGAVIDRTFTL